MDPPSETEPSKTGNTLKPEADEEPASVRFSPKEEASLVAESATEKTTANAFFSKGDFSSAIQGYNKALGVCPTYLDYDIAVLRSNISACHLKMLDWKAAISSATEALEALDRLDPPPQKPKPGDDTAEGVVEEVDDDTASKIEALNRSGRSRDDIQKLRAKVLLRRAKARQETGGWASLQGADEDYKALAAMPNLTPLDRRTVQVALRTLPPRLEEAKQKEMGEMMGKLKQLGNGILKPFGLSTDNFNFVKDESSGGYSMNFDQGR
ncbi:uncharacterized protein BDZ99DRAFT_491005 [Mytilinidion resinicola]|uniref:Tetratricopeptide repeat protein 1 n=1 Tax=Mytilinidion resinicola TaxID=574789 RepID=A0A6A6Y7W5_9PEZI|nr:uncharacterized protein BDZ99DRAFT_491005 [Mytilinidion resinicola]KAF2804931.1 hypothetical protein BDZ99DRAFT_491005 [Mytilinidion resinicola]